MWTFLYDLDKAILAPNIVMNVWTKSSALPIAKIAQDLMKIGFFWTLGSSTWLLQPFVSSQTNSDNFDSHFVIFNISSLIFLTTSKIFRPFCWWYNFNKPTRFAQFRRNFQVSWNFCQGFYICNDFFQVLELVSYYKQPSWQGKQNLADYLPIPCTLCNGIQDLHRGEAPFR